MIVHDNCGTKLRFWFRLPCLLVLLVFLSHAAHAQQPDARLSELLAGLKSGTITKIAGRDIASGEFLTGLYAALGNTRVWGNERNVSALRNAVARSWEDGLMPSDFHADALADTSIPAQDQDVLMSDAFARLLYQLYFGKVYPTTLDPNWNFARSLITVDPAQLLSKAIKDGTVGQLIEDVRLKHPLYAALKATLQSYTQIEADGGWPEIAAGATLKPDAEDDRVVQLRARLKVTGEFGGATSESKTYDPALVEAVKAFQTFHGLEADGLVGGGTLAELNTPVQKRIEQIRVNLERARWVLRDLSGDMVVVNIASQWLSLVLKDKPVWSTRVIVGKTYQKTPVFTEPMSLIVLNPDWTVPRSIIRSEIFPKASSDAGYLAANNYYLTDRSGKPVNAWSVNWASYSGSTFPYRVVQKPGPKNALGQVKFLFPNKFSVYLHDTPNRQLFDKSERSLSHGCIRVEDPLQLATLILGDQLGWKREQIDQILATGKLKGVALKKKLPVLLLYWTVSPTFDGGAYFFRDLYDRDGKLLAALDAPFKPVIPKQAPAATAPAATQAPTTTGAATSGSQANSEQEAGP